MESTKQHWEILQRLGTDLATRVREFMVIGWDGDGVIVVTEDGQGFWFGELRFDSIELRTSTEPTPLNVPGELVHMAKGYRHIVLLNNRGEIYSMGQNDCGQLGLGTVDQQTYFSPQLISIIPQHKFLSVRCGGWHSLALTEDGKCWAWGSDYLNPVEEPCFVSFPSPRQIAELDPHRVVSVECGSNHSLALTDRGEVYGWGANGDGQLGNGSKSYQPTPTRILTSSPVRSMACGERHTLLLTLAGEVWACGWNGCGELGIPPDTTSRPSLSKVAGLPQILQIAAHPFTELSIAMTSYQRCFVWGRLRDEKSEKMEISVFTPRKLSPDYTTVESPLSFFSHYCSTPNSVTIPETSTNRLSARMSRMLDNRETSPDVQFVVEQRTIHAHRCILSNSSDYFGRMFSERWLAPVDPVNPIVRVTITDHSYFSFHAFLRFLYNDCLEVPTNLLPEMFELASKYLVPYLQKLCLTRMRTTLMPATCCIYYQLTSRLSLPELEDFQEDIVQFASTRMSDITVTAAYQSMEPDLCNNFTNAVQFHIQATSQT